MVIRDLLVYVLLTHVLFIVYCITLVSTQEVS